MLMRSKIYPEGFGATVSRYVEESKARVEALVTGNSVTLLTFYLYV